MYWGSSDAEHVDGNVLLSEPLRYLALGFSRHLSWLEKLPAI
jgi:hypothetical protein